jgi:hypothetical protein
MMIEMAFPAAARVISLATPAHLLEVADSLNAVARLFVHRSRFEG